MPDSMLEMEDRYKVLFEQAGDAILLLNPDNGKILETNSRASLLLGYSKEELLNLSIADLDVIETREQTILHTRKIAKEGKDFFETKQRHKDGTIIDVEVSVQPIKIRGGTVLQAIWRDITDRKRVEEQLRAAHSFSESIIETAQVIVLVLDVNACIVRYNRYLEDLSGRKVNETRGVDWFSTFLEQGDQDRFRELFKKTVNDLQTCGHVNSIVCRDGSLRIIEWYDKTLKDSLGRAIGLLAIGLDITERKQAEIALQKSEAEFRTLFEKSATGYVMLSVDGHLLRVNEAMAKMLGRTIAELQNVNFRDITHPDDLSVSDESIRSLLAGENDTYRFEKRYLHKDGSFVWTFVNTTLVCDSHNSPLYFITSIADISDRKRTEEALRVSEARFKQLADSTFEAIIIHEKGKLLDVNASFCTMLGYNRSEVIGKPVMELIAPEWKELVLENIRNGYDKPYENGIVRKDGTIVMLETIGGPIEYQGRLVRVTAMRDISERKRMEEELQKVQKLESLGILAGGIAHDFNNLMGGIFGYIDLASSRSKDPTISGYLEKALSSINRARDLTQQLLTFAKGGAPIQKVGSLFPCVREAAEFALSGSNVSCRFDIPEDVWHCNFDRNQISQVIDNIVINAQHAMPAGGEIELVARNITIGHNEHPKLTQGNYARLSLSDHGIGIPKELLSRIFDPFFTTKSKGHGLGLATCYSIINRHGGAIDVESEPGKGSTFHIYLPAAAEPIVNETVQTKRMHIGIGTIIVMDDEEIMRDTISDMLTALGYVAKCTNSGKEALELLFKETTAKRSIAAMILDLTIPGGMGGKETIAEIRRMDSKIPVFVASGYADDPVMQNPSEYGFSASIRKPFMKNELAEMLSKYLPNG
jgi:two-component system cell cycle sensor histidine kinase/response regulator CckA